MFQWNFTDPLYVSPDISLPQLVVQNATTEDCTIDYSTGMFKSKPEFETSGRDRVAKVRGRLCNLTRERILFFNFLALSTVRV